MSSKSRRIEGHEPSEQLDDLVEYQSAGASPSSSRSTVRGVDKRDVEPLRDGATGRTVGTRWKWRGRGWLTIASSRWQLLGFDMDAGVAVSYFKARSASARMSVTERSRHSSRPPAST